VGIIPREYSSGEHQRLGGVTKQGSPLLRFLWGQAGAHAARRDPELKRFYRRKLVQKGLGKARVAVARKLGIRLWIIPRFPRLKEWAYAGVFFDLTGAVSSQLASGSIDAGTMAYPIVMTGVAVASWALRPPSRRLDPG